MARAGPLADCQNRAAWGEAGQKDTRARDIARGRRSHLGQIQHLAAGIVWYGIGGSI